MQDVANACLHTYKQAAPAKDHTRAHACETMRVPSRPHTWRENENTTDTTGTMTTTTDTLATAPGAGVLPARWPLAPEATAASSRENKSGIGTLTIFFAKVACATILATAKMELTATIRILQKMELTATIRILQVTMATIRCNMREKLTIRWLTTVVVVAITELSIGVKIDDGHGHVGSKACLC